MYSTHLPNIFRPGSFVRTPQLGVDLPTWFFEGLKGLDENLFVIWHPFRVLWDDVMNHYAGPLDDPRNTIHVDPRTGEQEIWGWLLTDGQGAPIPECKWHVWRLCGDRGWAHIFPINDISSDHLKHYLDRIHLRTQIMGKYGIKGWQRFEREEQALAHEARQQAHRNEFSDVMNENKSMIRVAVENMERGIVDSSNPTKEIIRSYAGQKHHTAIHRPLTDREGGFFTPNQD